MPPKPTSCLDGCGEPMACATILVSTLHSLAKRVPSTVSFPFKVIIPVKTPEVGEDHNHRNMPLVHGHKGDTSVGAASRTVDSRVVFFLPYGEWQCQRDDRQHDQSSTSGPESLSDPEYSSWGRGGRVLRLGTGETGSSGCRTERRSLWRKRMRVTSSSSSCSGPSVSP